MSKKNSNFGFCGRKNPSFCNYCKKDITFSLRIKCAECENFILCGDCFSVGVSLYPHEPSHSYSVMDCFETTGFYNADNWSVSEELLMLEAIEKCGVGNWKTVSDYMNNGATSGSSNKVISTIPLHIQRTPREIETRYWDLYVGSGVRPKETDESTYSGAKINLALGCSCFLPSKTAKSLDSAEYLLTHQLINTKKLSEPIKSSPTHYSPDICCCAYRPYVDEAVTAEVEIQEVSDIPEKAKPGRRKSKSGPNTTTSAASTPGVPPAAVPPGTVDLPGYMPLRCDFDVEYDNDAEVLLADMEFYDGGTSVAGKPDQHLPLTVNEMVPQEHPSEVDLKLKVVDIYNQRLSEREARKKFVIEKNLVDVKRIQQQERKFSKEERDLLSSLHIFSRFDIDYNSTTQQQHVLEGILKIRKLRKQIELLQYYRAVGVKNIDDAKFHELERKRKLCSSTTSNMSEASDSRSLFGSEKDKKKVKSNDSCSLSDKERELCEDILHISPSHYQTIRDTIARDAAARKDSSKNGKSSCDYFVCEPQRG